VRRNGKSGPEPGNAKKPVKTPAARVDTEGRGPQNSLFANDGVHRVAHRAEKGKDELTREISFTAHRCRGVRGDIPWCQNLRNGKR